MEIIGIITLRIVEIIMEIKRKLYKKMLDWKNQCNGSKALFIEGARRVGKSTISKAFGENEYRSYIFIDFNSNNLQSCG